MAANTDPWLAAQMCTWPEPWQTWYGGEYSSRRSPFAASSGWECPRCHRCYQPSLRECPHCQPQLTLPGSSDNIGVGVSQCLNPSDPLDDEDYER